MTVVMFGACLNRSHGRICRTLRYRAAGARSRLRRRLTQMRRSVKEQQLPGVVPGANQTITSSGQSGPEEPTRPPRTNQSELSTNPIHHSRGRSQDGPTSSGRARCALWPQRMRCRWDRSRHQGPNQQGSRLAGLHHARRSARKLRRATGPDAPGAKLLAARPRCVHQAEGGPCHRDRSYSSPSRAFDLGSPPIQYDAGLRATYVPHNLATHARSR
jgi:hypothetical protein